MTVAVPDTLPAPAEMVALPCAFAVTRPVEFTVAVEAALDVHAAVLVRFCVEPSE